MQPRVRTRAKPSSRLGKWFFLLFLFCLLMLSYSLWDYFRPNEERLPPGYGGQKPIFYRGERLDAQAVGQNETLKLPLQVFQEWIDPHIRHEEESGSVIVTTRNKVIRFQTEQLTALMNEEPFELRVPVEKVDNVLYLPLAPLKELYGLEVWESPETGGVMLFKGGDPIRWGKVISVSGEPEATVPMRKEADKKSPIVADLVPDQKVIIWKEIPNGWYHVQLPNSYMGYARKDSILLDETEIIRPAEQKQAFIPWKPLGGKINMTWEYVYQKNPETDQIGEMPGLNVVSPTWFHLLDGEGNIVNRADKAYVQWAHERNYQVWALFSNSFDPDLTSSALANFETRRKMIKQLLGYAQLYQLQGINLDFENVYLKDKDLLTQFVRELVPLAHEQGLVVSMDVTFKSSSENWSLFYDRKALAQLVDYMIIMAYDEHWASSPVAGSVSSLPWVEQGLVRIMEEDQVPPSKIILGVPFYTRIWTEQTVNGKTEVSSRAVSMGYVRRILEEKGLKPTYLPDIGQHYVEYSEDGKTHKIWLEDETSMQSRAELVKKYQLAGLASWRRGFEEPQIWEVIRQTLKKRP